MAVHDMVSRWCLYGITANYYRNEEKYRQDPEKPENT